MYPLPENGFQSEVALSTMSKERGLAYLMSRQQPLSGWACSCKDKDPGKVPGMNKFLDGFNIFEECAELDA